jgi:peptidoglycan/LPS O-acetylase OafA/YrhL
MGDLLHRLADNPATAYILSFGGLGLLLNLALNWAHSRFGFSDRVWGLATLLCGAVGGLLMQEAGFISMPGDHDFVAHALAVFVGAAAAAAAASFSAVDLRATMTRAKGD